MLCATAITATRRSPACLVIFDAQQMRPCFVPVRSAIQAVSSCLSSLCDKSTLSSPPLSRATRPGQRTFLTKSTPSLRVSSSSCHGRAHAMATHCPYVHVVPAIVLPTSIVCSPDSYRDQAAPFKDQYRLDQRDYRRASHRHCDSRSTSHYLGTATPNPQTLHISHHKLQQGEDRLSQRRRGATPCIVCSKASVYSGLYGSSES